MVFLVTLQVVDIGACIDTTNATTLRSGIPHETTIPGVVGMTLAIVAASATGGSPNEELLDRRAPDRRFRVTAPDQRVDIHAVVQRFAIPLRVPMSCFAAEENGTEDSSCALLSVAATSKEHGSGTVLEKNGAAIGPPIPDCGRPDKKWAAVSLDSPRRLRTLRPAMAG